MAALRRRSAWLKHSILVSFVFLMSVVSARARASDSTPECNVALRRLLLTRAMTLPSRTETELRSDIVDYLLHRRIDSIHLIGRVWAERHYARLKEAVLTEIQTTLDAASAHEGRLVTLSELARETRTKVVASVVEGVLASYANTISTKELGLSILGPVALEAGVKWVDQGVPGFDDFVSSLKYSVGAALAWPLSVRVGSAVGQWALASRRSKSSSGIDFNKYLEKISQDRVRRMNDIVQDGRNIRAQSISMLRDIIEDGLSLHNPADRRYMVANAVAELVRSYREMDTMDLLWTERLYLRLKDAGLRTHDSYHAILDNLERMATITHLPMVKLQARLDLIMRPEEAWKRGREEWKIHNSTVRQRARFSEADLDSKPPLEDFEPRIKSVESTLRTEIADLHFFGRLWARSHYQRIRAAVLKELNRTLNQASLEVGHRVFYSDLPEQTQHSTVESIVQAALGPYEAALTLKGLGVSLFGAPGVHLGVTLLDDGVQLMGSVVLPGIPLPRMAPLVGTIENPMAAALAGPLVGKRLAPAVKRWAAGNKKSGAEAADPHDDYLAQLGQERPKRVTDIANDGRNVRNQSMGVFRDILADAAKMHNRVDRLRMVANGVTEMVRAHREIPILDKLWLGRVQRRLSGMGLRNREDYHILRDLLESYSSEFHVPLEPLNTRLDLLLEPLPEWKTEQAK